jgi:hypothetical protein
MGVKVFDPNTRQPITPDQARSKSLDKRAYDQNYECQFADENMTLLTHELISAAERSTDHRSTIRTGRRRASPGCFARGQSLEVGNDIGRNRDLSMVTVIEKKGSLRRIIAMLRMESMRLPTQQKQLDIVCGMPKFRTYCGDMTGLGLGLVEYLQDKWGMSRIHGVNFGTSEPITDRIRRRRPQACHRARHRDHGFRSTRHLFEDRSIEIHVELDSGSRATICESRRRSRRQAAASASLPFATKPAMRTTSGLSLWRTAPQ